VWVEITDQADRPPEHAQHASDVHTARARRLTKAEGPAATMAPMSILCELFVADLSDALHYDDGESADRFEIVPLGGLTQLPFEILWAITEGRPWSPAIRAFEQLGESPDERTETWLFRFPPVFVARLAKLTGAEISVITAQWARTDELDCATDEIEPIVSSLIDLARSAVESNRGLYLWGSL
jgi:hypothetical protein